MKTSLIILSIFSLSVFSQNVISSDSEGLEEMATVIITRITKSGKEKNYLTSDSRIRLNNEEKRKFKRKPRMSFNVPEGQHTIYVTKLLTPGSSSVSFYAMPNETYTFNVYWRQEGYWAGLALGYYVGTSLESSLAGPTEGGQFGIVMTDTTFKAKQSDIEENKSTSEKALKVKRSADQDIESELTKIKELFEKGLITQEVYETKQKEILGLN